MLDSETLATPSGPITEFSALPRVPDAGFAPFPGVTAVVNEVDILFFQTRHQR